MQDELTLKELILVVQDYFKYFLRKWYWLLLGGLLMGAGFFYFAYITPINYEAPLTFMLNNEKGPSIGTGAILGSLGLGGGENGGGKAEKLLELARSRKVLGRVLFDSASIDGKTQLIADHIIDIYGYHEEWKESEILKGFRFKTGMPAGDNISGNKIFKKLYSKLIAEEDGLMTLSINESSGLSELTANTLNEKLSIVLVNQIFKELSEYFIITSISGKQASLTQLIAREDSVRVELNLAEARLARLQDRSSGVFMRQETVKGQQLKREVLILSTMYGEIVKNKEASAFLLANEKPAFNLIDSPLEPLKVVKESLLKALVIGGLLGGVLVAIVLFFVKLIQDALNSD